MRAASKPARQGGFALLLLCFLILGAAATLLMAAWSGSRTRLARQEQAEKALQLAREALIGEAAMRLPVGAAGYLPLPDLGILLGSPEEGYESGSFSGNRRDLSVLGKLPWHSLGLPPLRDPHGECLWYVVSGRFKETPKTAVFNWDTAGQIDVVDGAGLPVATDLAALIVAPGPPLDGQERSSSNAAYRECSGNYEASNYLDPGDAASGQANYFAGSANHRVAPDSANKTFVMAGNAHYNDHFVWLTGDDIFRPIVRRSDFAAQINGLLSDVVLLEHIGAMEIAGGKGTGRLDCDKAAAANQAFCNHWKEMLLATELPASAAVSIDGVRMPACQRLVIFAGSRAPGQRRHSPADKSDPANYLERPNLAAFAVPLAKTGDFAGRSSFDPGHPEADLLRCLP